MYAIYLLPRRRGARFWKEMRKMKNADMKTTLERKVQEWETEIEEAKKNPHHSDVERRGMVSYHLGAIEIAQWVLANIDGE